MSEEEIIDEIKYNILNDPFIVFSQDSSFEDVQIKANAVQGLLDLYNKEKRKNKRYETYLKNKDKEHEKVLEYIETEKETDYISKDKIREQIKELENIIEFEKPTYEDYLKYTIDILEELLEEE